MKELKNDQKHLSPSVTINCVIFGFDGKCLRVLLVERSSEPYKDCWALPSGNLNMNESLDTGVLRILQENTDLNKADLKQINIFSDSKCEPLELTIAYYALVRIQEVKASEDINKIEWFALEDVPPLANDHNLILQMAQKEMHKQTHFEPIGLEVLPEEFNLNQLRLLYETILEVKINRHDLYYKIHQMGILTPCDETNDHNHLYKFNLEKYYELKKEGFILDFQKELTETWDADNFCEKYGPLMEKINYGDHEACRQMQEIRVMVFQNTVDIVKQGHYFTESRKVYAFPDDSDMIRNTVFYENEIILPEMSQGEYPTMVTVLDIDGLEAGKQLKRDGYNPAVLNIGNRNNPGGGVITGFGGQEELLFRRTNLFRSLFQFAPYAEQYGIKPSHNQYPLDSDFGGIYTPNAIWFRDCEECGYDLLMPESLSFITVADINIPDLTVDGMIEKQYVDTIKNKIRTIFRIGLIHGHDSLVLGALGCGDSRILPCHIARLFHEVMDETEFKNQYRKIVFAIPCDYNPCMNHKPEFKPFAEEFFHPIEAINLWGWIEHHQIYSRAIESIKTMAKRNISSISPIIGDTVFRVHENRCIRICQNIMLYSEGKHIANYDLIFNELGDVIDDYLTSV